MPGAARASLLAQRRHHLRGKEVGAQQREDALGARRIECRVAGDGLFDLGERVADALRQRFGARGGDHVVAAAHEQLVPERVAQPIEGVADRRLAQPDHVAGPRHAALLHQRVEGLEQVEIEGGEIHVAHSRP